MPNKQLAFLLPAAIALMAACSSPQGTGSPDLIVPTQTPRSANPAEPLIVESDQVFAFYGADPSLPLIPNDEDPEAWNGRFISPGATLFHDGRFHMFMNGAHRVPGVVNVGYLTSPDGFTWKFEQALPVFSSTQVPYIDETEGIEVFSAVVEPDGIWALYFHTASESGSSFIGRATAGSPLGPWTAHPEPVLSPGKSGEWDDQRVSWPNVSRTGEGYVMFYGGKSIMGDLMIGRATSGDGVNWVKRDDPATGSFPHADSDPVYRGRGNWEEFTVSRARVTRTPEGWGMMYVGGSLNRRGFASSRDGINWQPHPANPVLSERDFPVPGVGWDGSFLYHDGIYYYFLEIDAPTGTNIFLAIHKGPLIP